MMQLLKREDQCLHHEMVGQIKRLQAQTNSHGFLQYSSYSTSTNPQCTETEKQDVTGNHVKRTQAQQVWLINGMLCVTQERFARCGLASLDQYLL